MGWASSGASKRNNAAESLPAKVAMRQRVLAAIPNPSVLDAFAGSGMMWRRVWRAADCVGIDLKWYPDRKRPAYVADNLRVMRCIDLSRFNIFDLDAHSSPWAAALVLASRRQVAPGELIGICLTDGHRTKVALGKPAKAMTELAGVDRAAPGMQRHHEEIVARAMDGLAERMRCDVVSREQVSGTSAARVQYAAMVLRGR